MDDLEHNLSYEDIRFFRSVARVAAKKDAATRRRLEAEQRKNQPAAQTWSQWLWGSNAPTDSESKITEITEDEQKEIDDIIDFSAWSAEEDKAGGARDLMRMRVNATLNKGSFSLRTDPHGSNLDVTALVFDSFSADVVQLTDSMKAKMALGGFRVYDGTTPNSLYPQIVRVKDIDGDTRRSSIAKQNTLEEAGGAKKALAEISSKMDPSSQPFFVLEFENKPLDGRADNAVSVKMRHLEIIYHRNYVEAVMAFLKPPASQLESINALLDAAGETLDGIRKETRAGLEYALEQHKTLDVHVDMNAPIIVIPMDVTQKNSQVLVLDAGHIAVDSKLADQEQLKDVQAKRGRQYSDDDYKQLENLMYDRLQLSLDSTQLLMGDDIDACLKALNTPHGTGSGPDLHIVERINMSFTVQNAIVNAPTLTKFKISGELPELQVNFSDRKYQTLMKFIDVAIPHFGDDDDEKTAETKKIATVSPAFQKSRVQEYNLEDTPDSRSIRSHGGSHARSSSHGGSSVDYREQFFDSTDDTTDSQKRELQQVNFEFSFSVGKLQASIFRSTSATTEKPLANASLEGFGLTFLQRKYEMSVDLFLKNVTLAMLDQVGKPQRPLLSSGAVSKGDQKDLKLVQVRYLKVDKDSPEFMTKHEGIDTSIDTELSTFNITLAPEPILSLYDFIMTTFVGHDEPPPPAEEGAGQEQAQEPVSTDKMRIRVKLTSAQVSLENNDLRFALLGLPSADVGLLLRGGTIRVAARLGNISLTDTTDAKVEDPAFKNLLTIEGEELADFSYETFNPEDDTFPGYNSLINLRAGSLKVTFIEETVHNLTVWLYKFGRMKAVYDQASQAAMQSASEVTRMRYDVVVKTPIIVLPTDGQTSKDKLILRLGEIVAKNAYLADKNDTSTIEASLTGVNVASEIHAEEKVVNMQLVDDVGITANIKQISPGDHRDDPHQADTEITTEMSDVKLSLTERQYCLVMSVLESIPRALSSLEDDEDDSIPPTPISPSEPPTPITEEAPTPTDAQSETQTSLIPELALATKSTDVWTSLDLVFSVKSVMMELFGKEALEPSDLKKHSIARFALINSHLGFKSLSNGAMEAEFTLRTLAFESTRAGNSVYRDIVPQLANDGNQM